MFFKFFLLSSLIVSINLGAFEDLEVKDPNVLGINQSDIDTLFDLSFEDDSTQSVTLLKNGYLIGERYANGFDKDSFGTSWSMAKSFYAALILISIDKGEIKSLDQKVSDFLPYFDDDRSVITIRQILNMSSGLQYPDHQHETMFFRKDHLKYSRNVKLEKEPDTLFEYNNVNSMLLGEILETATGKKADILLEERILNKIGVEKKTLWRDEAQNILTYCCIDMTARDFLKIGQLLLNDGLWNGERILSSAYVQQIKDLTTYGLKFWYTPEAIFSSPNPSFNKLISAVGFDGQYVFIDFENKMLISRNSLYYPSLDISEVRKMSAGTLGSTNFTVTAPTIITTNGETRLTQVFSPTQMINFLYTQ